MEKKPGSNKNILKITYVFAGVFFCLLLYLAYFLQFRREDVINNSYNARLELFEEKVRRGSILSNDGHVLAETVVDSEGNEKRNYPYDTLFNHVVGYSTKGKTGLESLGNFYLLTSHENLLEQTIHEISGVKSPGDNVVTTLDVKLQQAAWDALGDRRGAVAVMEPDTGKVLAMVSKPGFSPNSIDEDWESLIHGDSQEGRLLNRATQGLYPPGSVFKIVTLLEYMRENPEDYMEFQFDCDGIYEVEDYEIRCYHQTAHGNQNISMAFANSCNGAFASMGQQLDLKKTGQLAKELLFNQDLPISLPYSQSSYMIKEGAGTWEILQTFIGQGETQVTPIHQLMLISAIANGGVLMKPYFIDHTESSSGETVKAFSPEAYGNLMTPEEAKALTGLLRQVVTDGTGSAVRTDQYPAAGKTGSAEFETGKETHGWFIGFAPADDPEIAVSVIVEESGSGGKTAAPVARAIFDVYFSQ